MKKYSYLVVAMTTFFIKASLIGAYDRAVIACQKDDLSLAESMIKTTLIDDPLNGQKVYDAGVIAYRQKKYDQAINYFKQVQSIIEKPSRLEEQSLFNLGNTHVKKNSLEEAVRVYEEVAEKYPENSQAQHNLEKVKQMLKQQQEEQKKEQERQKKSNSSQSNQQKKTDKESQKNKNDDSDDSSGQKRQDNNDNQNNDTSNANKQKNRKSGTDQASNSDKDDAQQKKPNARRDEHDNNGAHKDDNQSENNAQSEKQDSQRNNAAAGERRQQDEVTAGAQQKEKTEQSMQAVNGDQPEAGLDKLNNALAYLVEQQGKQDADLNKQLIKLMVGQQKRRKHDRPEW